MYLRSSLRLRAAWPLALLSLLSACIQVVRAPTGDAPQLVLTQIYADHLQLYGDTEIGRMSLELEYSIVDGSDPDRAAPAYRNAEAFLLRVRVYIVDVATGGVVAVIEEGIRPLPPIGTAGRDRFVIDRAELALAPGSYTLQPILLVARPARIHESLSDLYGEWITGDPRDFTLVTGNELGFQVLDDAPELVAGYRSLIDSGVPDRVLRGLSQLVMHFRVRGQFAVAERAVEQALVAHEASRGVSGLSHVFRSWQADDIARQGDAERAVRMLAAEAARYPDRDVLGMPYGAFALEQQARIWRAEGDGQREIAAYGSLIERFPELDASARYRSARAEARLLAGDWQAARADFESIVSQAARCAAGEYAGKSKTSARAARPVVCPIDESAQRAGDVLAILDSDRGWFRNDFESLAADLKTAFETGDPAALAQLARAPDFQFGNPGGHTIRAPWSGLISGYFGRNLQPGRYELSVPKALGRSAGRTSVVWVRDTSGKPGSPSHLALMLQRTPFGAQWRGLGGLRLDDVGDPGPGIPPVDGGGPRPPPPPVALRMKASWAPGTRMRAGGIRLGFESLADNPIQDVVGSFLRFDRCGSGVPGYFYDTNETHVGRNRYSIDFVKGATVVCTPGWVPFAGDKCLPNAAATLAEYLDALAKAIPGIEQPVRHGAFLEPIHLGYPGLVVNVVSDRPNGDKDGLNRVDVAAWRYPPRSIKALTKATTLDPSAKSDSAIVTALNAIDPLPDFWIKHLHLAHESECRGCAPSVGMWVDRGRIIGRVDDTGSSSFMSHLHLAVYGHAVSATAPLSFDDWQTRMQHIEDEFIGMDDNGKCIKSTNALVTDTDGDKISDQIDNCVLVPNPEQIDRNFDDVGDICSDDRDNDGIPNDEDSCPDSFDWFGLRDIDLDGVNDLSIDLDGDGINNSCDTDADGDGVPNETDICQYGDDADDMDGDGEPDFCDVDADGDGASMFDGLPGRDCPPQPDLFPFDPTRIGDYDEDGIDDLMDDCPCSHVNPVCLRLPVLDDFGVLQRYELR